MTFTSSGIYVNTFFVNTNFYIQYDLYILDIILNMIIHKDKTLVI